MSEWEEFCDDMGWKNDDTAYEKLDDYIEGKESSSRSFTTPKCAKREFTPQQKREYAQKKAEERRLMATPIAKVVRDKVGVITSMSEHIFTEKGVSCRSIQMSFYAGDSWMTITKIDNAYFEVSYVQSGRKTLEVSLKSERLTENLIDRVMLKYDKEARNWNRSSLFR